MGIYGDFSNAFKDVPRNVKYYMKQYTNITCAYKPEMFAQFFFSIWLLDWDLFVSYEEVNVFKVKHKK